MGTVHCSPSVRVGAVPLHHPLQDPGPHPSCSGAEDPGDGEAAAAAAAPSC